MFKELDKILRVRATPKAPDHLSAQIIAAAARLQQNPVSVQKSSEAGFLKELLDMLALPSPAVAMAAVLVFGIFSGFWFDGSSMAGLTTDDLSVILSISDRFIAEEWI